MKDSKHKVYNTLRKIRNSTKPLAIDRTDIKYLLINKFGRLINIRKTPILCCGYVVTSHEILWKLLTRFNLSCLRCWTKANNFYFGTDRSSHWSEWIILKCIITGKKGWVTTSTYWKRVTVTFCKKFPQFSCQILQEVKSCVFPIKKHLGWVPAYRLI